MLLKESSLYEHLPKRLLAPERPRESLVRSLARRVRTPEAGWEFFVQEGLLPESFLFAPHRRFGAGKHCREDTCVKPEWGGSKWGVPCVLCAGLREETRTHPAKLTNAMALAADATAVVTVEALADEYAARCAAWGHPVGPLRVWALTDPFNVVVWRPWGHTAFERLLSCWCLWNGESKSEYTVADYKEEGAFRYEYRKAFAAARGLEAVCLDGIDYLVELAFSTAWRARHLARLRQENTRVGTLLEQVMKRGSPVDKELAQHPSLQERREFRVSDLPDLFEPLLGIYDLGYVPVCVGSTGMVLGMHSFSFNVWKRHGRKFERNA